MGCELSYREYQSKSTSLPYLSMLHANTRADAYDATHPSPAFTLQKGARLNATKLTQVIHYLTNILYVPRSSTTPTWLP